MPSPYPNPNPEQVYCLAMANNTVYGGCQDCKIRVWNLNTMQKSYMLIGHEGVVRLHYLVITPSPTCSLDARTWCAVSLPSYHP